MKMKILIVDDEPNARKLLEVLLTDYGECVTAANGVLAVEAVRSVLAQGRGYDLIYLDIMMPQMDGHETLRVIRQIEAEHGIEPENGAKVIMTSAMADADHIIRSFRSGSQAYIIKPVTRTKLIKEMLKLGLVEPESIEEQDND